MYVMINETNVCLKKPKQMCAWKPKQMCAWKPK